MCLGQPGLNVNGYLLALQRKEEDQSLAERNGGTERDPYLFIADLAFTSLDNLVQVLLDGLFEAARDLVGVLELLAVDLGHDCCI